jgi:hypothetical protein
VVLAGSASGHIEASPGQRPKLACFSHPHKRIEETMLYVHAADNHRREIPEGILAAGAGESDPNARIIKMLGARGSHVAAAPGLWKNVL